MIPSLTAILNDRKVNAAMNVAVFTPYAYYLAKNKPPPTWLIWATLGWTALQFVADVGVLLERPNTVDGLSQAQKKKPLALPPPSYFKK